MIKLFLINPLTTYKKANINQIKIIQLTNKMNGRKDKIIIFPNGLLIDSLCKHVFIVYINKNKLGNTHVHNNNNNCIRFH